MAANDDCVIDESLARGKYMTANVTSFDDNKVIYQLASAFTRRSHVEESSRKRKSFTLPFPCTVYTSALEHTEDDISVANANFPRVFNDFDRVI